MSRTPPPRPRRKVSDMFRTKYSCCGRTWHDGRLAAAHHYAAHSGYWAGDKARKTYRKMNKDLDRIRRMARGGKEAFGLTDRLGRATSKGRARPLLPRGRPVDRKGRPTGHTERRPTIRDLRNQHRHGRDSDRTDRTATRLEDRARRADSLADRNTARADRLKGTPLARLAPRLEDRSATHRGRAAVHRTNVGNVRMRHHQMWPERTSR